MISAWVLAVLTLAFGPAGLAHTPADVGWVASGGFCEPETVLPLPDASLLVSNVCGFAEPGKGYLSLLDPEGEVIEWRAVDGLDSPLGMAYRDGRLYVVDDNTVRVLAWPGFEPLDRVVLGTRVANDIAVADDGTLYVSDTAGAAVVRVPPGAVAPEPVDAGPFPGANGVAVRGRQLFVGGARLWIVDLHSGTVETWGPEWLADIDGIEFEADGTLQLTPVGGPLVRYRTDGDIEIVSGAGVSSANHGYNPESGVAYIPTGFDNTVIAIRVPSRGEGAASQP